MITFREERRKRETEREKYGDRETKGKGKRKEIIEEIRIRKKKDREDMGQWSILGRAEKKQKGED
jgi:hypothetical protein